MYSTAMAELTQSRLSVYQNVSSVENLLGGATIEEVAQVNFSSQKVDATGENDTQSALNGGHGFPVRIQCSNGCGVVLESRSDLERHVDTECPLAIVDCSFRHVGCEVRLTRKALPTHLAQAVVLHQSLQMENYEGRMKMLEADNERLAVKCKRLETAHKELEQKISGLIFTCKRLLSNTQHGVNGPSNDMEHLQYIDHTDLLHSVPGYSILNFSSPQMLDSVSRMLVVRNESPISSPSMRNNPKSACRRSDEELNERYINAETIQEHQKSEHYSYILTSKSQSNSPAAPADSPRLSSPVKLTMTGFERHKSNDDNWVSQPFYTHSQGYKMCLRVTANGQGSGKGTHITVAVYLMKGEFDDQLEWPFRGDITIQLLNQQDDREHFTRTIYQALAERSEATTGEKFISAWCIRQFKPHSEIVPKYLRNDDLTFRVSTTVRQPVEQPTQQLIETEV